MIFLSYFLNEALNNFQLLELTYLKRKETYIQTDISHQLVHFPKRLEQLRLHQAETWLSNISTDPCT